MENGMKGTVTPLASIFPAEEAQKAAKLVQETIADRQKELDHLHNFVVDNTNLVNLVQRLPDELSHDVMVPFGKAAFFPGRLIHTNEFMILLGEGYYVERTSKQTTEILQRRGKVLQEQVDSMKAMIEDLKTEASFFDATAIEAAEGLVEIREECIEESPSEEMANQSGVSKPVGSFEADNVKDATEDEEYARIMARLDELEKVELAAESNDEDEAKDNFQSSISQHAFDHHLLDDPQQMDSVLQTKEKKAINETTKNLLHNIGPKQDFVDQSTIEDLEVPPVPKEKPISVEKPLLSRGLREKVHLSTASRTEVAEKSVSYRSETGSDSSKAFTGSIIEHTHGLQTKTVGQTTTSQPSKPVSRFKMQKGGR